MQETNANIANLKEEVCIIVIVREYIKNKCKNWFKILTLIACSTESIETFWRNDGKKEQANNAGFKHNLFQNMNH